MPGLDYSLHIPSKEGFMHSEPNPGFHNCWTLINDALTDTADTFRLGSGGDLGLIGDFTVVKEKNKIHVQRETLICLQRDKKTMRSGDPTLPS